MQISPTPEIHCLAQTIHGEAQGESTQGQEAVAQVIINRLLSPKFPKTICGVVRQPHQFSGYNSHIKPSKKAYEIAKRVISYTTSLHHFLYFNTVGPKRAYSIGHHKFW